MFKGVISTVLKLWLLFISCVVIAQCKIRLRTHSTLPKRYHLQSLHSHIPLGILTQLRSAWNHAKLEQHVQHANLLLKNANYTGYFYLVMPLSSVQETLPEEFSYQHLNYGDKVSMPAHILQKIIQEKTEPPWHFAFVKLKSSNWTEIFKANSHPDSFQLLLKSVPQKSLDSESRLTSSAIQQLFGSPLDFRSLSNFIFMPKWMMKHLSLSPYDIIFCYPAALPTASKVTVRPHSLEFFKLPNYQSILELELRHYSTLTKGTTITIKTHKKEYTFTVLKLEIADTQNPTQHYQTNAASIQDADIQLLIQTDVQENA